MKRIFLFFAIGFFYLNLPAQTWVEMKQDPNANFYETVAEFNAYWAGRPYERGQGYKQFRRWEEFMAPRVYPKGDVKQASRAYEEFQKYLLAHPVDDLGSRAAAWTPLGPTGAPAGGGAGRTNFVRFDPLNTNIVYTGSPAGGLWKSTNSGTSWTTGTDQLSVIGCTDVAIDPSNTNIMYLATGDGDAGDTYSIGVLKSTDGGSTWLASGLAWTVNMGRTISKLIIHPTTPSTLLAATSNGIYRTTNSGTSWTQVQTGDFKDIEFKPGDPNTVYAAGDAFYLSTSGGATWTNITSGVPAASSVSRFAIGVTPANSAYVYLLAANNSSGFLGVYRSTNSGTSFTTRSTTPNILGWDNGGDAGGQGWYDLCIAVSNTNAEEVFTGGINIWRSTNGGTTFTLNSHWYGGYSKPYVHADIHDLTFLPGSGTTVWSANDGGVFRTTNNGTSWSDLSSNLQIAQQYRVGLSTSNATLLVTGHQDNGTNKMNGSTWTQIYGGDGMDCFIDRTNNNNVFASYVYGDFQRSTDGGTSWTNIVSGLSGTAPWLAAWHQDPVSATTLYAGYTNLFKSTNSGTTWTSLAALPGTGTVVEFDIAPSNNQYIYVLKSNAVYKTTNGGTSWTTVTSTLPVGSAALTNVEISPTDPQKVWVTFSGYSSGNKVFYTSNGGTSWTNISTGLPNIPANCIVYQTGSGDGLYVGTDVGVYYIDNTFTSWQPYFAGLPNVIVRDLEIYYATGKLRAATYGRSSWETDLYSPGSSAPVAQFTADRTTICAGQTVNFTDLSTYSPTSWSWTFTGGTPSTSTLQNPSVVYNTPGTYAVTLVATNINGSDTETKTAYITVSTVQPLPVTEGFESTTFAPTNWFVKDANSNGLTWTRNGTLGAYGTSTACAMWDNYNNDDAGARDELSTAKYDFSSVTAATLTFDVAYARYNATYSDSLAVLVSTDCGVTFTQVFLKGGTTLATNGGADVTTAQFVPTTSQWRNESVSLSAYAGQPDVMIVFQNRARYGQALYLDNVNITATFASVPTANFTGTPTAVCAGQTVTFTNTSTGATSYSWTFAGGTPGTSTATNPTVTYNTPGTYNVTLVATNASGSDTELKTGYIVVTGTPTTSNAGPDQTVCAATATLAGNTPTTGSGTWTFISGPATPTITTATSPTSGITGMTATGTYVFRWTISNAPCTASTDDVSITRNGTPTTSNAGPDQTVCAATATLAGNTPTTGTGSWTFISGPATPTITTASSPTSGITGMTATGTYVFRWTISNAPCTSSTDDVSITRNGTPTTANAGPDASYCSSVSSITLAGNTPTTGTGVWTLVSGPGSPTITSPSSATSTVTGLSTVGTYIFQWTISNPPCTASSDQVTITITSGPTIANAGPDQTVCTPTSTVIMAGNTPSVGSGLWTKISGPAGGTITSATLPTTPITALGIGTYVYQWTITSGTCPASTDQVTITVNGLPTTANAGPDQSICGSTATLAGNTATSGTGTWTFVSGPATPTITTPTAANSGITGMSSTGTYVFQWTIANAPCTASSDQVSITVTGAPVAAATSNSPLCATDTLELYTPTVTGATYSWTGPASYTSTSQNPIRLNATTGMSGTYTVTVTVGSCTATSSVSVTVNGLPTATATNTSPVCEGNSFTVSTPSVSSATYSWTGPLGFTSTLRNPTITGATLGMAGVYTVTVTKTTTGCSKTSSTTVTIDPGPISTATNNGPLCEGETLDLSTPTVAGATYSWSGPAGFTSSLQNPSVTTTLGSAGTYTVTVALSGCSTNSPTTVVVDAMPSNTASNDGPACEGSVINLSTPGALGATYSWTGPAGFASSDQNPILSPIDVSMTGTYTVDITSGACNTTATTTINVDPTPSVTLSNDVTICEGQTTTLIGPSSTGTYLWSPSSGLSADNVMSPDASPVVTTTYILTVTEGPCSASDSIVVNVNPAPVTPTISQLVDVLTASPSSGFTYQWYLDGAPISGATSSTYTMVANGDYSVVITDGLGCTSSSSALTFNSLQVVNLEENGFLSVYPNPTNGNFTLSMNTLFSDECDLIVHNSVGQSVYSRPITFSGKTRSVDLNLSTLAKGHYTITVIDGDKRYNHKLIIN